MKSLERAPISAFTLLPLPASSLLNHTNGHQQTKAQVRCRKSTDAGYRFPRGAQSRGADPFATRVPRSVAAAEPDSSSDAAAAYNYNDADADDGEDLTKILSLVTGASSISPCLRAEPHTRPLSSPIQEEKHGQVAQGRIGAPPGARGSSG